MIKTKPFWTTLCGTVAAATLALTLSGCDTNRTEDRDLRESESVMDAEAERRDETTTSQQPGSVASPMPQSTDTTTGAGAPGAVGNETGSYDSSDMNDSDTSSSTTGTSGTTNNQ